MKTDLPISCTCGRLRGKAVGLTSRTASRAVCYCKDCQAYAHYLGRADDILDANGGTEVCQVSPRTVRFEAGAEQLACVRLGPKGPYRWYAACCRTPIANTISKLPFVGLVRPAVNPDDESLGPLDGRIFGRHAVGDTSALDAADGLPAGMALRAARKMILRRLRGDHKRSPFHDHATGKAAAKPTVLTLEEREALEEKRTAWTPGEAP